MTEPKQPEVREEIEKASKLECQQTIDTLGNHVIRRENDIGKILLCFLGISVVLGAMGLSRFINIKKYETYLQSRIREAEQTILTSQRQLHSAAYDTREYQNARDSLDDYLAEHRIPKGDQDGK